MGSSIGIGLDVEGNARQHFVRHKSLGYSYISMTTDLFTYVLPALQEETAQNGRDFKLPLSIPCIPYTLEDI